MWLEISHDVAASLTGWKCLQILFEKIDELLENDESVAAVPEAVKLVVEPLPVEDDKTGEKDGVAVTVDLGSS